ncbi:Signal peptide peptidase family protein [Acanthocheilonema viteae]
MDYIMFTAWNIILLVAAIIIYSGCRRSYSIYFFERDAKKIVFLENEIAIAVPIVASVMLIILHYSLKLSSNNNMDEKMAGKKRFELRASSISRQLVKKMPTKLDSISESAVANNDEEMKTKLSEDLFEKMKNVDDSNLEEYLINDGNRPNSSFKDVLIKENEEEIENVDEAVPSDETHRESSSPETALLRRSSILSDDEIAIERKRSEIYKKIVKVFFFPSVDEVVTVMQCPSIGISKHSVLVILGRLIAIHIPLWLGVIAVQITLVEIFDNHIFYYHHPKMKQLSIVIAILLGIFHEIKWTWFVNDVLGIATSYVIIARTETASYFAGFLFLLGMISFDIFWFYCVDLFSLVTKHPRSPVMLTIPLGKNRRPAGISTVDIIVPGIFLNIVLKFAEMYDIAVFILSFYACIFGLFVTELVTLFRQKSTPAIVIPGIFAILVSLLSADNSLDLWRFGIKY